MSKSFFNIREALEVGTDKIVDAYKKATPGEVKEQDDAPASPDEAGMAMDQAKFIGYVADEIMEYIQGNNEFPEWMQNKLSALHEKAKGMHAVMAGKYESVEEARKYTPPTKAEIEADKKKDRAGKKRPSMSAKSAKKSIYKNMMGGLKEEDKVECPKCKGEGCDHCDGKGYHMTEAKQKNWIVTVVKPINKLKKGMKVIVPARNTAEAMKKALKKMGENPAAIGSGYLDVKLDEAAVDLHKAAMKESVDIDPDDGQVTKAKDDKKKKKPEAEIEEAAKPKKGKTLSAKDIKRALASKGAQAKSKDKVTLKKAPWESKEVEEAALTVGMKQPVDIDDTEEKGHMDAVKANKAGPTAKQPKKIKELRK